MGQYNSRLTDPLPNISNHSARLTPDPIASPSLKHTILTSHSQAAHASSSMSRTRPSLRQRTKQILPTSLRNGIFSRFPLVHLTPSVPRYLRQLLHLNGGTTSISSDVNGVICLVSSPTDPLLGTLYMRYCAVFDCQWIEACLVAGVLLPPDPFVIWPWDYRGNPKYIPQELFDFDPEEIPASGQDRMRNVNTKGNANGTGGANRHGSLGAISPKPFDAPSDTVDSLPLPRLTLASVSPLKPAPPAESQQADRTESTAHSYRGTKRGPPNENPQSSTSRKRKNQCGETPLTMHQDPPGSLPTDNTLPRMATGRPMLALTTSQNNSEWSTGGGASGLAIFSHRPSDRLTTDKSFHTTIKHSVKHPFHAPFLVSPAPEHSPSSSHTTRLESLSTRTKVSRSQDHQKADLPSGYRPHGHASQLALLDPPSSPSSRYSSSNSTPLVGSAGPVCPRARVRPPTSNLRSVTPNTRTLATADCSSSP
ncbi:hypothetical protein DB88DRAFT_484201 [Papiliotrema laurentii]|uniref:BRCT domain-containing protein n=1 Tax=Papiliotrema laurentii TaxID=5418 RepID=A0AAD9FSL9_PAPLA|nr:hypothetical protein DB88DRAFT_484201 [Papiliotrema laurentii]